MIYIKDSSAKNSGKVFKYTFLTVFAFTTIFSAIRHSNGVGSHKVAEEFNDSELIYRTEAHDVKLPIAGATAEPHEATHEEMLNNLHKNSDGEIYTGEHGIIGLGIEIETVESIVGQETAEDIVDPERPNKLYCVVENGLTSTLDVEYQDYLWAMCEKYNMTQYYELLMAQMYHESTFNPDIVSNTNDYGLMQINEYNHDWLGGILGNHDFLDPYNNIEAGVYLMNKWLTKYKDVQKALVCYNRGESAVINGTHSTDYSTGVLYDMRLLVEIG